MSEFKLSPTGVVLFPHKVLRESASKIGRVTRHHYALAHRMVETMIMSNGLGLAAPQVGESLRLIVIQHKASEEQGPRPLVMIDPEIIEYGSEQTELAEGCLSIPGRRFIIKRPSTVKVSFLFLDNQKYTMELSGIAAKCVQHEIDHLNGILICDRGPEYIAESVDNNDAT